MRRRLALVLGLSLLVVSVQAQSIEERALRERLAGIARLEALDESVRRPVELATQALERAAQRNSAGDVSGAERARAIALAAVELAEARLHLLRERALQRAARQRRTQAADDVKAARSALERELARARELSGAP
jgi:hypothetical protein